MLGVFKLVIYRFLKSMSGCRGSMITFRSSMSGYRGSMITFKGTMSGFRNSMITQEKARRFGEGNEGAQL